MLTFCSNLAELEVQIQKIKYEQEKIFNKKIDNLHKESDKIVPIIADRYLQEIRQQLLAAFTSIGLTEFYNLFTSYYGKNFDRNILRRSLTFGIDNNLRPQLSYIVKEFATDKMIETYKKSFNKHRSNDFDRKYDSEYNSLEALEELEFYGYLDSDGKDIDDWAIEESDSFITEEQGDFRQSNKNGVVVEAKYVYQQGYNIAMEKYLSYYNSYLKKYIENKYKIKL